jgi:hypothetical protein
MTLPLSFNGAAAELIVKKTPLRLVRTIFSKTASSVAPVGVRPDPGIGEDDIQLAEISSKIREELLAVLCHGNVGTIAARVRSKFCDCLIECRLIATREGDLGAFCDEKASSGETDSAVAAGDESCFACEFHISSSWPTIYDSRHT